MDKSLVKLSAVAGVDRLLSHPKDKAHVMSYEEEMHDRYVKIMHGMKSMRPMSIRVN